MHSHHSNFNATNLSVGVTSIGSPSASKVRKFFGRIDGRFKQPTNGAPGVSLVFRGVNVGAECSVERSACEKASQGVQELGGVANTCRTPAP